MQINIKRVYEPAEPQDGFRVLADRLWPRGMSKIRAKIDFWSKDTAPSTELREWYGHDPAKWAVFQKRYLAELKTRTQGVAELLEKIKGRSAVTLVYAAKDEAHTHALVLQKFLRERVSG